jgi:predicted O-methyltransferase YrrM
VSAPDEAGAARVREVRRRLIQDGPVWTRGPELDFATVTLPERDCDLLRDLMAAERVSTVVEVGLAYGSSALAIGEALLAAGAAAPRHVIIDPFQRSAYHDVGWNVLAEAGLTGAGGGAAVAELIAEPSSLALPRLLGDGVVADAAFVDGSHRFHEVFVDLYFLRKIVRPGGLVVLDDAGTPSVRTAVRYFERNLGWTAIPGAFAGGTADRCLAMRLPDDVAEPPFEEFQPF